MTIEEISDRLFARIKLPCDDCTDDFTCGCCGVDQEMLSLVSAVREVENIHRRIRTADGEWICSVCPKITPFFGLGPTPWPCDTSRAIINLKGEPT